MAAKLTVIVLNWNGKADTLECLGSLAQTAYPGLDVILVDNGSSDGSVAVVREQFQLVNVIENSSNQGFAANNLGLRRAFDGGADYALLLNNDTTVEPDCFARLVEAAECDPAVGMVSPRICLYDRPDTVWFDGGELTREHDVWRSRHVHVGQCVTELALEQRPADFICGCAMLVRRSVFERIGGLDDRFFLYWEDVDYSIRARRAGFKLLHVPAAVVYHKAGSSIGGAESPDLRYYLKRNAFLLSLKDAGLSGRPGLLWHCLRRCYWDYGALMEQGKPHLALAEAEAGWHALLGRWGKRKGTVPAFFVRLLEKRRQAA